MSKSVRFTEDTYLDSSAVRISEVNRGRNLSSMLKAWSTGTSGFDAQISEFQNWIKNNCEVGTTIVDCLLNGVHYSAIIEKASNTYMSFIIFGYGNSILYKCNNGGWSKIDIADNYVRTKYLGSNPEIDTLRAQHGTYGLYGCSKAPNTGIGVLEVLVYSSDWVIQRFTVSDGRMWQRTFTSGTTWSSWSQKF